ncbi:ATP-binding protein [Falsiroseomonas sp. CW058]|uniref:hybrid sensor histidine kinase/response regulator n=1 Tax=Falsiroseomonas sp. CW058 TaxID=3388664 RepID=UPI003D3173EE
MPNDRIRLLILSAVLFVLAAMVGLRASFLMEERETVLLRAESALRDMARVTEEHVSRVFETSDLVADYIADRVAQAGGAARIHGDPAMHHWLRDLSQRMAGDYLMIVDAAGRPVSLTAQNPPPAVDLSDRRWFRIHAAGEERHVGEALHSRITDEVLFTYSRALRGGVGFDGAVQVAMRTGFFQREALLAELGSGTALGLFDAEGRVLARTGLRPDQLDTRLPAQVLRAAPGPGGVAIATFVSPFDGVERLAATRRLEDWPVLVSASIPKAAVLAGWWRAVWWSVALLGGIATAALLATFQALRMMRREAGVRAELAAANSALRAGAAALETRVAERTRDLAAARDELAERERRFRAIFDSTFQFVGLLAPDGTLLEANETALAFGGFGREEVIGRPFWEARWWDTDEATRQRLRDAIAAAAAGRPQRYEVVVRGAGDVLATIDFSLKPIRDADGRVVLLVPEGHDVTDLKAAEARLREAQKTEMLGQLTGGVAHDFNNLLMAVLGNLALLRKRMPEDPRLLRLLDGAQQGAERGAALTQRLLAFARRQELRPEPVDLPGLLDGVRSLLERSAGAGIRLRFDLPAGLAPAMADANQLELALLNLVVNARDAMPDGGEVAITVAERLSSCPGAPPGLLPGPYLVLSVRDSGTGMDEATLARATEPFFTTKGPGRGSGLGLSMVQGLAQQSGGGLALRSTPGEGTVVEIWLPRAAGRPVGAAPAAAPEPPRPQAPPRRVLVVDDDPLVAAGTALMLEDLGHRPVVVASAAEALLTLAGDPRIDMVLTDHAMPGMTGLELAERLRRERPDLPVALATGYADLAAGTSSWLPRLNKPYRQEDLAGMIARLSRQDAAGVPAKAQ